jgi:hypothetical protein
METLPEFGFKELFTHLIADMAKAVCERAGESRGQQVARSQAAAHTVMGLRPRDMIEAMLAGHCMMFHELMVDSVRDVFRDETAAGRRATRASIVNLNKSFDHCLARLEYYQTRPSQGRREVPVEPAGDDLTAAPVAEASDAPVQTVAEPSPPETTPADAFRPSAEDIAACRANPEAMAALEAGDPERFARAMGIDQPNEAYIAAASGQMAAVNGKATGQPPARAVQPRHPGDKGGDERVGDGGRHGPRNSNAG